MISEKEKPKEKPTELEIVVERIRREIEESGIDDSLLVEGITPPPRPTNDAPSEPAQPDGRPEPTNGNQP
jgi:hypothetical protein